MIKNKKGFTLVEILAVIVLISLIIIIAVPSVKSISYKSKKKLFNTKVELTKEAVNLWGTNNKTCFTEDGGCNVLMECTGTNTITCTTTFGKLAENGIINYDEEHNGEEFVVNPVNSESLNNKELTVTLENDVVNTECAIAEEDGENINREEDEDATGEANLPNITVPSDNQSNEAVLIVAANGGSYSGNEITETTKDTTIELSVPEKQGYEFTGWEKVYGDGSINGNNITIKSLVFKVRAQYKKIIPSPVNFATDSWETISNFVQSNKEKTAVLYKVGDTKEIALYGLGNREEGANGLFTVRIANNSNYDCTLDSKTACGFVVEFVDIVEERSLNSTDTNKGGWPATDMYKYLNGDTSDHLKYDGYSVTLYSKLPSDLQEVIIDTTVVSGHGWGDTGTRSDDNWESTDKLYLLTMGEIYSDCLTSNCEDTASYPDKGSGAITTRQLDYYNGVTTSAKYKRARKQLNGTNAWWWLRAANSFTVKTFRPVETDGSYYNFIASLSGGVAPAFRIG